MIRPLHHQHTFQIARCPLPAMAAAAVLLAGCGQSNSRIAQNATPISPETEQWVESSPAPAEVVFTTGTPTERFDTQFVEVAAAGSFRGAPTNALTADSRNISVFGDLTPGMTPRVPAFAGKVDGEDNLTRITYSPVGGDYDPDISPDGEFMVFSSTQHHTNADIYLKKVGGRSVTQLTSDPAHDVMPNFSPDGRRVAFASDRSGNWDIYVMSIAGGQPMQVTTDASQELHPTWSPDGSKLAYCRLSTQSGRWEIWVADLEGAGTHTFLTYGLFPKWSPNPSRPQITFQRARERDSRLFGVWTIDFINGEAINPTEVAAASNAALINPTWSPDASHIVFAAIIEPTGTTFKGRQPADLWMVDPDGLNRVNLTNGRFTSLMPTWSTNGRIYFVSNREGVDNIWSIGPERGLLASAPDKYDTNRRTATTTPTAPTMPSNVTPRTETPTTQRETTTATVPLEIIGETPFE